MKGYRTILIGAAMVIAPPLLTYLAGINWSDYVSPTAAVAISGAIMIALRVVTTGPVGSKISGDTTLKIFIAALALSLFLPRGAVASDVASPAVPATKALSYQYPTTKCGLYYGINSIGSTGSVANSAVGTQQVTGAIGIDVGYTCPAGAGFWFLDGTFDFTNVNGSTNGLSLSGPAMFEQRFGFGAPVDMIISALPGLQSLQNAMPSLIPLPTGVSVNTSSPYVFASLTEQDVSAAVGFAQNKEWMVSPGLGIGNKVRLSNGVVFDPFAEYVLNSNAMCFGPLSGSSCVKLSTQVRAGFHLDF